MAQRSIPFLFMAAAVAPLGLNIVVPALPAIGGAFAAPHSTVQLTMSVFLLFFGGMQLVLGPLADRFGRRPVLLGAFAVFVAASLWAAAARSIESLVLARALQAAGGCAALVLPRAIVRDSFGGTAAARAMAYVTMAISVVPALAPLVGGALLSAFGWQSVFLFCAGYGALMIGWVAARFAETLPTERRVRESAPALARRYAALLRTRVYLGYTLNLALIAVAFAVFLSIAPELLIRKLGVTPATYGVYHLLLGGSALAGSALAAKLAHRFGINRLLAAASILAVGALTVALALSGELSIWRLMGPMVAYGVAAGLMFPLALTGATGVDPRIAGAGSAFIGFAQMACGSAGVFLVGQLDTATARPFAAFSLVAAVGGLLSLALVRRRR